MAPDNQLRLQSIPATLLLLSLLLSTLANAQTPSASSAVIATPTAASLAIIPSTANYAYYGCYNETTQDAAGGDTRALSGGSMNASDTMTVQKCLSFCGEDQYAGLEYGRECWCSVDLNPASVKLSDSNCSLGCSGNATEACGGSLKLTLYQRKAGASGVDSTSDARGRDVYWKGLGIMGLGVVAMI